MKLKSKGYTEKKGNCSYCKCLVKDFQPEDTCDYCGASLLSLYFEWLHENKIEKPFSYQPYLLAKYEIFKIKKRLEDRER